MDTLYNNWMQITAQYGADKVTAESIYQNLLKRYNEGGRYYHDLNHVQTLLHDIGEYYSGNIPHEVYFAIWFHDAIYNTLLGNNEARSAELAEEQLRLLNVPADIIKKVSTLILKTANHANAEASDEATKVFLDADLKILGIPAAKYEQYTAQVRKEYHLVPDMLFNRGRRKFIEHTLALPRIYRTDFFGDQYEVQARINLANELKQLQ